jgi:hypothetical protein
MNDKSSLNRILLVSGIILIAASLRLVPHWPNLTPIAAMALFGGACLNKKWLAFLIPVVAMFVSDLIIGFHSYMAAVYICFIITVVLGFSLTSNRKFHRIALTSIASSIIFFILTNLAVWIGSPFYSQDMSGLMTCYAAALPFFNDGSLGISFLFNGIIGDLFYNFIFFGAFALVSLRFPTLVKA